MGHFDMKGGLEKNAGYILQGIRSSSRYGAHEASSPPYPPGQPFADQPIASGDLVVTMQLAAMLSRWEPHCDTDEWILGTVYKTEGSSYRKPGAMSLISSGGEQLGLLSGGCLEADIRLNARKVMASGIPVCIRYDGDDEDDLSYRLGIGCGGVVHVLLEPVNAENNYQGLLDIQRSLANRQSGHLKQHIPAPFDHDLAELTALCSGGFTQG